MKLKKKTEKTKKLEKIKNKMNLTLKISLWKPTIFVGLYVSKTD